MEQMIVRGVAHDFNQAKITLVGVQDRPGVAFRIFEPISKAGIPVDMIIQNASENSLTDLTFTVQKTDYRKALDLVKSVSHDLKAKEVRSDLGISKVSVVGVGMRTHAGAASTMFEALSKAGINILMISTSEIKISCVIDEKYTELAVRVLHEAFKLEGKPPRVAKKGGKKA